MVKIVVPKLLNKLIKHKEPQPDGLTETSDLIDTTESPESNLDTKNLTNQPDSEPLEPLEERLEFDALESGADLPRSYTIGENAEFNYFDDIISLLSDGDIVKFDRGAHVILSSKIPVKNLTISGLTSVDTLVDVVPTDNGSLFELEKGGKLTISNLTIRFAPKSNLVTYDTDSIIDLQNCNVQWNHYKISQYTDNMPLITPKSKTTRAHIFSAIETYIMSVDVFAKHITINNSGIGDNNGVTGHLIGWAENWENANFHNMILSIVGTAKALTVLGYVVVDDIPQEYLKQTPNLGDAPFIIENLLFGRVAKNVSADSKLLAPGSITERVSRFKNALVNDEIKAINLRKKYWSNKNQPQLEKWMDEYEFVNLKSKGATYIDFNSNNVTTEKRAIYNRGNLVLSGTTHDSTSSWACVQGAGQLLFNKLLTKWLWAFESEAAVDASRFKAFESHWSDTEKNLIKLTPTSRKIASTLTPRPMPIQQRRIRKFYEGGVAKWETDLLKAHFSQNQVKILVVPEGITADDVTLTLRQTTTPVVQISNTTISESKPSEKVNMLKTRLDKLWICDLNAISKHGVWKDSLIALVNSERFVVKLALVTSNLEQALTEKEKTKADIEILEIGKLED